MNDFHDRPQLPLTTTRRALVAIGAVMFLAEVAGAFAVAPLVTGIGDGDAAVLGALWCGAIAWSAIAVLCLVRQTDIPDVATASMVVTIATFGAFALSAAIDARGTDAEGNLTDALFLGVTGGALSGVVVWGGALGIARLLRLPTTAGLNDGAS